MVKRSALTKCSIAFAVLCAIICVVAITPLASTVIFALIALLCLLLCILIYIIGAFVWLFSGGQANIFGFASTLSSFGLGLFNFIGPIAEFSFQYLTPIAGAVAVVLGILGIIVSSVGISKAGKQNAEEKALKSLSEVSALPQEINSAPEDNSGKKKKRKKKTNRGACIASLSVSCVFSAVAVIAIIVAVFAHFVVVFN